MVVSSSFVFGVWWVPWIAGFSREFVQSGPTELYQGMTDRV